MVSLVERRRYGLCDEVAQQVGQLRLSVQLLPARGGVAASGTRSSGAHAAALLADDVLEGRVEDSLEQNSAQLDQHRIPVNLLEDPVEEAPPLAGLDALIDWLIQLRGASLLGARILV